MPRGRAVSDLLFVPAAGQIDDQPASLDEQSPPVDMGRDDAAVAGQREAQRLVLAQQAMSSQPMDNLNASIHIRALLTDIFLIDETLKARESDG